LDEAIKLAQQNLDILTGKATSISPPPLPMKSRPGLLEGKDAKRIIPSSIGANMSKEEGEKLWKVLNEYLQIGGTKCNQCGQEGKIKP